MLAIVCPGQGSQTSGFLSPWMELPPVAARLSELSQACGVDLVAHGTTSDEDTIRDTAVAQPLIVGAGLAALAALAGEPADLHRAAAVMAGHSVGEITASGAVGVLDPADAMRLVQVRGSAMAQAAAATPTGMSAVLGGDPDEVTQTLARHGLTAANRNGAGQVVAAGTLDQLAALSADPPRRARVVPLKVAGAFHTDHMAPAVAALSSHAAGLGARDAAVLWVSNADGVGVTDGGEVLTRLVNQVSNPVRWDLCMETMAQLGVTGLLELPPAGTLVGLAKRAMPGVQTVALRTPDDLDDALRLIADHGEVA